MFSITGFQAGTIVVVARGRVCAKHVSSAILNKQEVSGPEPLHFTVQGYVGQVDSYGCDYCGPQEPTQERKAVGQ